MILLPENDAIVNEEGDAGESNSDITALQVKMGVLLAICIGAAMVAPDFIVLVLLACGAPVLAKSLFHNASQALPAWPEPEDASLNEDLEERAGPLTKTRTAQEIEKNILSYTVPQELMGECCQICQEDYLPVEILAGSKNEECLHQFHLHCVTEWLVKNDECPICRRSYFEATEAAECCGEGELELVEGSHIDAEADSFGEEEDGRRIEIRIADQSFP